MDMMRTAVVKVLVVMLERKRKMSQSETGMALPLPALETKPRACPISCAATDTKSTLSKLTPSSGLKSKSKFLLKEIVATVSFGFKGNKPSGWARERDTSTTEPSPVLVGTTEEGSAL